MNKTATIILNWNGADDTILCIESVYKILQGEDYVFIIDNHSSDRSIDKISTFFHKHDIQFDISAPEDIIQKFDVNTYYYIVQNNENLGFGAGNNTILKKLNTLPVIFEYVWLLNNDAVVEDRTLSSLKQCLFLNKMTAIAGSIVLNQPDNGLIQNTGAKYYPFLGVSKLINKNQKVKDLDLNSNIDFDYLNGSSLLLRLNAIHQVGYFDERYFLYSEELDLQISLKNKGYKVLLVPESRIFHKLMGSTKNNSHLFYYYYSMSSILLTRKHYSSFTMLISLFSLLIINLIRTFPSFKNFKWAVKGIFKGLSKK